MQSSPGSCRIQATALACRRGTRVLFAGVSLALDPGDACRVLGTNGTGKTSLIRIVAGLAPPWAGTVERRGTIGLLDERCALDPLLPLGRALRFWARSDGAADDAVAGIATRLGLADLLDVPVRYLSTGQRKRAALARLIAQDAAIWLLDEPLNGLDTTAAALVVALSAAHCERGGICVVASHQPFAGAGVTLDLAAYAA